MNRKLDTPPKQTIALFMIWLRLPMLIYLAVLLIIGADTFPAFPLLTTIIYTTLILILRYHILNNVAKQLIFTSIDLLFTFFLVLSSGGYDSPYYVYSFAPLFLWALMLGFKRAVLLSIAQSALFLSAVYINYRLYNIGTSGGSITTDIFSYFIVGITTAYLAHLLDELNVVDKRKANVQSELEKARSCLRLSLIFNKLSEREAQVLLLSSEGRTVDQIAETLGLSNNTVKTYLKRIYEKLDVSSKQAAISLIISQAVNRD